MYRLCELIRSGRRVLQRLCVLLAAAVGTFLEGVAVHAFLHGGIAFVGADVDNIKRAVIFAAHIVTALFNGAMDIGVLLLIHHNRKSSFHFVFAQQINGLSCWHSYSMHPCDAFMHEKELI